MLIIGNKYKFTDLDKKKLKCYNVEYIEADKDIIKNKLSEKKYKHIILNIDKDLKKEMMEIVTNYKLESVEIFEIEYFLEKYLQKIYIPSNKDEIIDWTDSIKPFSKWQYIQKKIIDLIISIPLVICSSPVILYSMYRIKKESPEGEIIFKQKRVGLNGKEYVCYKFRSMVPNAEKGKPQFTSKNDPRVFKWGAFMRKTRIDELPQLWNVFKGNMHLIGPRPERKYWVNQFKKSIPLYDKRHLIKPGITGWAQINYPYGNDEEDARQKLMYDLYYIKNWSLWLEMKIVFKTAWIVLKRDGI